MAADRGPRRRGASMRSTRAHSAITCRRAGRIARPAPDPRSLRPVAPPRRRSRRAAVRLRGGPSGQRTPTLWRVTSHRSPMSSPRPTSSRRPLAIPRPDGSASTSRLAARVHERSPRPVLRQPRPPARTRTRESQWGRARVGVLAHRRRPLRSEPRRAPATASTSDASTRSPPPASAHRARRWADRPRPLPRAHVVLARRAGGRALRAAASSTSTRSMGSTSVGRPPTASFPVRVADRVMRCARPSTSRLGDRTAHVPGTPRSARAGLHARVDRLTRRVSATRGTARARSRRGCRRSRAPPSASGG